VDLTEVEASIEVEDPDLSQCGTGPNGVCFAAAWVMLVNYGPDGVKSADDVFNQAGWSEDKGHGNVRMVFTYNSNRRQWMWFSQYVLNVGNLPYFAVEAFPDLNAWNTYIFWQGFWNLLDTTTVPALAFRGSQEFEHWWEVGTGLHAGVAPIQFFDSKVKQVGGDYQQWDATVPTGPPDQEYPYCVNMQTPYYVWQAYYCP
jgi:hypothetical protein